MDDEQVTSPEEELEYNPGESLQETYYDMRRRGSIIVWIGLLILLIFAIVMWLASRSPTVESSDIDAGFWFIQHIL